MSYPRQTPPMYHYVFPADTDLRINFRAERVDYEVQPIRMLNGNWAIPVGVFGIVDRPQALSENVRLATELLQLTCCDFRECRHDI